MTLVTGLVTLGVGALAYDKLYQRSLLAHRAMITAWLASAFPFAYGLTLPNNSKHRLQKLEENYQERRVKVNADNQTRYDVVASIGEKKQHVVSSSSTTYPNLYKGYNPFNPFPNPILAAPSAPPQDK